MEIEKLGLRDVTLMAGERIDSGLNLRDEHSGDTSEVPEAIVLTDRRLIHVNGDDRSRKSVFVSLQDIDAIEITNERPRGYGAYAWAGMAFIAAIFVWRTWDHPLGSGLGAIAVAFMGVYLVADHLLSPRRVLATFRAGYAQLQCSIDGKQAPAGVHAFVNRVFELKEERAKDRTQRPGGFTPH